MHACTCACVWGHPITTPKGGTPGISQNSIAPELIKDISILFEDLKSVQTSPPKGGCIVWWVGGWVGEWVARWVGSGQITKNLKIFD